MIGLTPKENLYIGALSTGMSTEEISKRFSVSRTSLKSILYRIRKKAGVETNTQLVVAFLTNKNNFKTRM